MYIENIPSIINKMQIYLKNQNNECKNAKKTKGRKEISKKILNIFVT